MKKLRNLFWFALIVFIITSIHLWYQYVVYSSDKIPSKWGTIIEWTTSQIAYLPYLSISKSDKWYQHLLFRWCILMGSWWQLTGDLCDITTSNNRVFTVTLRPWSIWSDGTPITVNDIYFTYYDIIKTNQRGLPFLDSYSKLEIQQNNDWTITITFPRESVDNQLFFINPIVPAHILTTQSLWFYQRNFAINPVTSWCGTIKQQTNDRTSVIFDLTRCDQYNPQILQVKQFNSNTGLQQYIESRASTIDYVIDGSVSNFQEFGVASTQAIIAYFHVNTLSDTSRRQLWLIFNNILNMPEFTLPWFIKYQWLFDLPGTADRVLLKRNLWLLKDTITTGSTATGSTATGSQEDIPILTRNVLAYGTNKYRVAYLPWQDRQFTISFKFDEAYDKVAVSANGPFKYFPESYNKDTRSADYNLSTAFNNLRVGKNTYTVRWYKWDKAIEVLNLTIYYINRPSSVSSEPWDTRPIITNLDGTRTLRIIYVTHPTINNFIDQLKLVAQRNQMDGNISFTAVNTVSDLEEMIGSKSYEVIIRPIDLWSRNDLSILVHDDPMINHSQYKNQTFKTYLSNLNQSAWSTRNTLIRSIQQTYRQDVPFVLLGNTMEYFYINPSLQREAHSWDKLDTIRDKIINQIRSSYTLDINYELLYSIQHLATFLLWSHVW